MDQRKGTVTDRLIIWKRNVKPHGSSSGLHTGIVSRLPDGSGYGGGTAVDFHHIPIFQWNNYDTRHCGIKSSELVQKLKFRTASNEKYRSPGSFFFAADLEDQYD